MKEQTRPLSTETLLLIQKAYEGLNPDKLIDYHVHLIGTEREKTGNFVHPNFLSWKHPFLHGLFLLFKKAFHVRDVHKAEEESLERLLQLAKQVGGSYYLLAFDRTYENSEKTHFFVSNEFIYNCARQNSPLLLPTASIHPYRLDALDELDRWAGLGVKIIKWLPNVMGINPSDPRCIPYYKKMHDLGLILLTHAGHESLLPLVLNQELGNPLLLRKALDQGVRVIMAHSATLGSSSDLDHPSKMRRKNFDLFLRMIKEPQYQSSLFGDIAAVTILNRMGYLDRLIEESQRGGALEDRLVNGSDYPLPCIPWAISTKALQLLGYVTSEERKSLNELFRWNPLLFDFVLKCTLKHTKTQAPFPKRIFMKNLFEAK